MTELNPGLPRDVWRVVRHCLAKEPDWRYQTAKDVRNDLDELAQSLSSGELAPAAAAPSAERSSWPMRATFAIALLGLLAAFVAWQLRGPASLSNASPPTLTHARLTQQEGLERWPSLSPDGKWVVYVATNDIYLQSVTGQTAINLTKDTPSSETTPAFSPDGETIRISVQPRRRRHLSHGTHWRIGQTVDRWRLPPRVVPGWEDDRLRRRRRPTGTRKPCTAFSDLLTVSRDGGEPRLLFAGDAVQPRVSPKGQRIAFWNLPSDPSKRFLAADEEPANRDIWTIDASGGNPVSVAGHEANDWNPVWSPDGRWLYFLSNRSGSMGLWRVAIDEASGVTSGEPQPLATPAWYVADFGLSATVRPACIPR